MAGPRHNKTLISRKSYALPLDVIVLYLYIFPQTSDAYRKHYFADLRSKFIVENYLNTSSDTSMPVGTVNLSNRDLTSLHYCERFAFVEVLDLSNNNLTTVTPLLPYLRSCRKLILSSNDSLQAPETALGDIDIIL